MKVILNADDFGISTEVNRAILMCFREGLISTTTIMPNMPAFEDAARLAFANNFVHRIGVHLNLTEGAPLTEPIRNCRTFCDANGNFKRRRHYVLTASQCALLSAEVRAQIERCRNVGLPVTHLDSHHHSHTEPGKFAAIRPVLDELQMKSVRLSRNVDQLSKHSPKAIWKTIFNRRLQQNGWQPTTYFGCVSGYARLLTAGKLENASIEVECHPGFDSRGQLIDLVEGFDFRSGLESVIQSLEKPQAEYRRAA